MNLKYLTSVCLNSRKMEGTIGLAYNVVSFDSLGRIFNKWLMARLRAWILESTREACVLFNVRWRGQIQLLEWSLGVLVSHNVNGTGYEWDGILGRQVLLLFTIIGPAGVQTYITSRKVDWCLINELSIHVQYICIMRPNLSLFSVTVYRYLALRGSSSPYTLFQGDRNT